MRLRATLKRPVLAIWLLVALVVVAPFGLPAPVSATPGQAAEAGSPIAVAASLANAIDGPGHHFGFSQASILAQATATAVPGSTTPCANQAGQVCTVTGNGTGTTGQVTGSGTITSTGAESWTLTASIGQGFPGAPVVPAGTIPVASFTTTTGTQTFQCTAVTFVAGGANTTCTGTTPSPAVQGSTVTVTFVTGATATGLVTGPGPVNVGPGNPPASTGQAGVPCTATVGGVCTISGAATGTWTRTSSGTFSVSATGPANTAPGSVPQIFLPTTAGVETFPCNATGVVAPFTATCNGTTVGNLLAGATATVRFALVGGGTTDVTGLVIGTGATATPTPGTSLTTQQALALVAPSGQPGVPCAVTPGDTCTVTGVVTGTGRVTSSMLWNLTVTVPAAVGAGIIPVAVFSTTSGLEAIVCAPVIAGVTTVTCSGTTVGNALQGSTVTVVFAVGIVATGTVTGPGAATLVLPPLPLLPPPVALLPPPPPPLLPPPPPGPTGMALAQPIAGGRFAGEVPIVPEADSVLLVIGGLAALGLVAGLRARRRAP
ncbi:MAG TPA: hypothetical protein VII06_23285 [Chloroflexota bacterium]